MRSGELAGTAAEGRLSFRLATAAAIADDLVGGVVEKLLACGALPSARADDLEAALQEALGNAVMHGNLELDGSLRQSPDGVAVFGRMMAERLADPAYADRPLDIDVAWDALELTVCVADRGRGFDPVPPASPAPSTRPSGRGLSIIRAAADRVRITDNGRRMEMSFRR